MSCIPPETRRHRTIVSPRKRSSSPLGDGLQCTDIAVRHPAPGFPRFRDFRARTAYAGEADLSPSASYYTTAEASKQARNNIRRAEKTLRDAFFPRCPCLLYKIGIRPARKDTRRAQENNDCPAIRFYSNRRNTQKAASGMTRMRPEKRFVPPVHTGRRLLISA